jgi:hypothetical protein
LRVVKDRVRRRGGTVPDRLPPPENGAVADLAVAHHDARPGSAALRPLTDGFRTTSILDFCAVHRRGTSGTRSLQWPTSTTSGL